jgi:hypothetical protein
MCATNVCLRLACARALHVRGQRWTRQPLVRGRCRHNLQQLHCCMFGEGRRQIK